MPVAAADPRRPQRRAAGARPQRRAAGQPARALGARPSRPAARAGGRLRRRLLRDVHAVAAAPWGRARATRRRATSCRSRRRPSLARAQRFTGALAARLFRDERASAGRLEVVRDVAELEALPRAAACSRRSSTSRAPRRSTPASMRSRCSTRPGCARSARCGAGPTPSATACRSSSRAAPDTGPGLTDAGQALVRACNQLGVLIDLSHLNEQGFWDVARLSRGAAGRDPLQRPRALPDLAQPDRRPAARDPRLRTAWSASTSRSACCARTAGPTPTTPLEVMVRHFDHLIERLGEDKVGFGSDFDGTIVPAAIKDAAGLPHLVEALRARGLRRAAAAQARAPGTGCACSSSPGAPEPEADGTAAAGGGARSRAGAGGARGGRGSSACPIELRSAPDAAAYAGVGYLAGARRGRRPGAAGRLRRGCRAGHGGAAQRLPQACLLRRRASYLND